MRFSVGAAAGIVVVALWLHFHERLVLTPLTEMPLALGFLLFMFSCVAVVASASAGRDIRRSAALGACWGCFAASIAALRFI